MHGVRRYGWVSGPGLLVLLAGYSLAGPIPSVIIEDFEDQAVGIQPAGWTVLTCFNFHGTVSVTDAKAAAGSARSMLIETEPLDYSGFAPYNPCFGAFKEFVSTPGTFSSAEFYVAAGWQANPTACDPFWNSLPTIAAYPRDVNIVLRGPDGQVLDLNLDADGDVGINQPVEACVPGDGDATFVPGAFLKVGLMNVDFTDAKYDVALNDQVVAVDVPFADATADGFTTLYVTIREPPVLPYAHHTKVWFDELIITP